MDPKYLVMRKGKELSAVIQYRPFLDCLYIMESVEKAKRNGETNIRPLKPSEFEPAHLIVLDEQFPYIEKLRKVFSSQMGYDLSVKRSPEFMYPATVKTPHLLIDLQSGEWDLSGGIEVEIPVVVFEQSLKSLIPTLPHNDQLRISDTTTE